MKNLFENRLIMDAGKTNLVPLIAEELAVIPARLINFVFEKGFKIYVPVAGDKLFFARNRLKDWGETSDARKYLEVSYFSKSENAIVLIGDKSGFIKNGHPHSVIIHEFAHAVDYVLSTTKGFLHQKLPKGEPLDFYAARNTLEKFAVAFEAFCHPEFFRSNDYRTHNQLELFKKSPEIFKYFEQFFESWKKVA